MTFQPLSVVTLSILLSQYSNSYTRSITYTEKSTTNYIRLWNNPGRFLAKTHLEFLR